MKIIIPYDSKWSVSLMNLEGLNFKERTKFSSLEGLLNKSEKYEEKNNTIDSVEDYETIMKKINKNYENFDYREISHNTVLGILARLMGEVRNMSIALKDKDHLIHQLKSKTTFKIKNRILYNEVISLHTPIKDSRCNGQGIVTKNKDSLFLNKNIFSIIIFSIFNINSFLDLEIIIDMFKNNKNEKEVIDFLEKNNYIESNISISNFIKKIEAFNKKFENFEKNYKKQIAGLDYDSSKYTNYLNLLSNISNINKLNNHGLLNAITRYLGGILVYTVANWLININYNIKDIENKVFNASKNVSGIASLNAPKFPGALTIKDFYNNFAEKKETFSSPYMFSLEFFKKTGEKNNFNTKNKIGVGKEDGILEINIDIPEEEAIKLKEQIENAAVSTFQMGKKGLAYVKRIEI